MSEDFEAIPVFDEEDARMVGWEIGYAAEDGNLVIQARCECGCGVVHALELPPGALIRCDGPELSMMDGVRFHGPMRPPRIRELPGTQQG